MLSSTEEYLQALHEGDYLTVLQFPEFIGKLYCDSELGLDDLIDFTVFEFMNHGFSNASWLHVKKMRMVFDQIKTEVPLTGEMQASLLALQAIAVQCMIYIDLKEVFNFPTPNGLNKKQLLKLLRQENKDLSPELNSQKIKQKFEELSAWQTELSEQDKLEWVRAISLLKCRSELTNYVDELALNRDSPQGEVRYALANALQSYVSAQTHFDLLVCEIINQFVGEIRKNDPLPWEAEYLDKWEAPPSTPGYLEYTTSALYKAPSFFFSPFTFLYSRSAVEDKEESTSVAISEPGNTASPEL